MDSLLLLPPLPTQHSDSAHLAGDIPYVQRVADDLYFAMKSQKNADLDSFQKLLIGRSKKELMDISRSYHAQYQESLEETLSSVLSGRIFSYTLKLVQGLFAPDPSSRETQAKTNQAAIQWQGLGIKINFGKMHVSALIFRTAPNSEDVSLRKTRENILHAGQVRLTATYNKAATLFNQGCFIESKKVYEEALAFTQWLGFLML